MERAERREQREEKKKKKKKKTNKRKTCLLTSLVRSKDALGDGVPEPAPGKRRASSFIGSKAPQTSEKNSHSTGLDHRTRTVFSLFDIFNNILSFPELLLFAWLILAEAAGPA